MISFKSKISMLLLFLFILSASAGTVFGKSKYEKITNGIGNILIGEVLPYNDDNGYRNVVDGSVKLSQLSTWESFYYRAYLPAKISEIKHDVRILVINFKGIGGESGQFNKEDGDNVITWTLRSEDSVNYGGRSEWSRYFPDFQSKPATFTYFIKPYDYTKPQTFEFPTSENDISGAMNFSAETLKNWKDKYNLTAIDVTMQVFSFVNKGSKTTAETKKVIEAKPNTKGGYDFEENEKISSIKTSIIWGDKQFLAKGKFRIILD